MIPADRCNAIPAKKKAGRAGLVANEGGIQADTESRLLNEELLSLSLKLP